MTAPRAPANRVELIEVMARAAWWCPWEKLTADDQGNTRTNAAATLAALEARGVRLVPAEATDGMRLAMLVPITRRDAIDEGWRDAVAASPYAPEAGR